jgi:hypothetical protein
MEDKTEIRILEKDANRRGDLFGRLMADLFVALGYEQPSINSHKAGRELDLSADHRLEPRRAIGECKATSEPIGGADLNKFVGVLDVEQEDNHPITGYFISLSGFTEPAMEQEKQRRRTKIVTLSGSQVVSELVNGRILIAKDRATELAGRCCVAIPDLALDHQTELLAHERGWIWAIYYTQGKERTHFALIHSDGTLLARALAEEVAAADRECGGRLEKLICLNPEPLTGSDTDPHVAEALAAYGQYIASECGYIQLDGLPADREVGSQRHRLEDLFVPLHLDVTVSVEGKEKRIVRKAVGSVLAEHPRLALLAAPGGGKSTLVKRLAVAYVDPARRKQIDDDLPQRNWLPLFFRCRELRGLARGSFAELLDALSRREPVRQHATIFRAYVDRALLAGRVLLLVDGLDEISDPSDRAAFVCTVRTALQAYPGIATIVTSREAGFRHVAAHLAPVCTHATVSAFDSDDIRHLTIAWHQEVFDDTEKVRAVASQLAESIVKNDRIRRLAINPLLLTTLLLVERWLGRLPTRRAMLYEKAVEVLLMTWNVEGHEPIPDDEAMPQLCYIAAGMMLAGLQKISRPRLAILVQQARKELPTELGYVKGTVDQFIHRVEDRSSLLMMTGHDVEDGRLVEFFEFRHLTFQEFLTARAMVAGWHPCRREEDTLVSVLEPHFMKEDWREVIPLAAVLGGRATEKLIQRLTQLLNALDLKESWRDNGAPIFFALGHSLADEAAARPDTVQAAIRALVRIGLPSEKRAVRVRKSDETFVPMLAQGRYGVELRDEAQQAFLAEVSDFSRSAVTLKEVVWWQATAASADHKQLAQQFIERLSLPETLDRCEGGMGCIALLEHTEKLDMDRLGVAPEDIGNALIPLLFSEKTAEQYVAGWGLWELGKRKIWTLPSEPDVLGQMFALWQHSPAIGVRKGLPSTIAEQLIGPRDDGRRGISINRNEFDAMFKGYQELKYFNEKSAALIIAWYLRSLSDEQIAQHAEILIKSGKKEIGYPFNTRILNDLLKHLGEIERTPSKTSSQKFPCSD